MTDEKTRFQPISSSYEMASTKEMSSYYDNWAEAYEEDVKAIGWVGWRVVVDGLLRYSQLKSGMRILDFGCGTGNAGAYLREKNSSIEIIGVDISTGMLDQARKKGCYNLLRRIESTQEIREEYDAVVCSGVFTHSHIEAEDIRPILCALKPGGILSVSARESFVSKTRMDDIIKKIDSEGYSILQAVRNAPYQELLSDPDARGAYWVIQSTTSC